MGGFTRRVSQYVISVREAQASVDYTHVDSSQLLFAEWLQQESVTSYPPKVLKYIVAKNRVRQVYNKEATDGYMDRQRNQIHGTRALEELKMWFEGIKGSTCYTISDSGSLLHLVYYRNELMPYNYTLTHAQH